jgi:hypothetical protein
MQFVVKKSSVEEEKTVTKQEEVTKKNEEKTFAEESQQPHDISLPMTAPKIELQLTKSVPILLPTLRRSSSLSTEQIISSEPLHSQVSETVDTTQHSLSRFIDGNARLKLPSNGMISAEREPNTEARPLGDSRLSLSKASYISLFTPFDSWGSSASELWTTTPIVSKSSQSVPSPQEIAASIVNVTKNERLTEKDSVDERNTEESTAPIISIETEGKKEYEIAQRKQMLDTKLQQFIAERNAKLMRKILRRWRLWCRRVKTAKHQKSPQIQQKEAEYQKLIHFHEKNVFVPSGLRTPSETLSELFVSTSKATEEHKNRSSTAPLVSPFEFEEKQRNLRQYLRWLRLKTEERQKMMWQPLDLPALIYPILRKKNPAQNYLFWKALLIVPTTESGVLTQKREESSDSVDVFVDWLTSKFSKGGVLPDSSSQRTDGGERKKFPLLSLYKAHAKDIEVDESDTSYFEESDDDRNIASNEPNSATLRVCIKLFNNPSCSVKDQQLRDELRGTHVLLWYLPHPGEREPHEYWQEQREILQGILKALHPFCSAPLLVLFHPEHFTNKEINPQLLTQLNILIENNLQLALLPTERICSFQIMPLSNSFEKCEETLIQGVRWLASQTARQLPLHTYWLKDVIESKVETILDELVSRYNAHLLSQITQGSHNTGERTSIPLPQTYITKYNESLRQLHKELMSEKNIRIAYWPVPEFIKEDDPFILESMPPENWNTQQYLERLELVLRSLQMPDFPQSDPQTPDDIIASCFHYLKLLSSKVSFMKDSPCFQSFESMKEAETATSLHPRFVPLATQIQNLLLQYFNSARNKIYWQRSIFPWHKIFERIFYFQLSLYELEDESLLDMKVVFVSNAPVIRPSRKVASSEYERSYILEFLTQHNSSKEVKRSQKDEKNRGQTTVNESKTIVVGSDAIGQKTKNEHSVCRDDDRSDESVQILYSKIEELLQEIETEKSKALECSSLLDKELGFMSRISRSSNNDLTKHSNTEQCGDYFLAPSLLQRNRKRKSLEAGGITKAEKRKQRRTNSCSTEDI